jgi:predicted nucleotide-binding protein (sugar kinase/HSP70/actin superfamily)
MGAYGAALYSMKTQNSTLISREELASFTHTSKSTICKGCTNNCHLTVNTFANGKKFISGNQCERGLGIQSTDASLPNLHAFKREYLTSIESRDGGRGTVGLPLALGMYELLPLWHGIFTSLGFNVLVSSMSTRRTYEKGQFSIPSDTACYPAKIMHGHIEELVDNGADAIFYPCLTYNIDEHCSDNHFNCPVVAYYSELLGGNMESLENTRFLFPYLNINDRKELVRELYKYLSPIYDWITVRALKNAVRTGFEKYNEYMKAVREK